MLEVVKGQNFPQDKMLLGSESVRGVFDSALKRARNINDSMLDRVMLAVENDKNIVGIMDVKAYGDQRLQGFAVWNDDNLTRKSLIRAGVKETAKLKDIAFVVPTKDTIKSIKDFFRTLKFTKPRDEVDLMIPYDKLEKVNIINDKTAHISDYKLSRNVDLAKVLKLDE